MNLPSETAWTPRPSRQLGTAGAPFPSLSSELAVCTPIPSLNPPQHHGATNPGASRRWRKRPRPRAPPAGEREGGGGRGGAGRRAGRELRRREEAGSFPDGAAASEPGRSGEGAAGQEPGSASAAPGAGTHVELPRGARGRRQVSAAGPCLVRRGSWGAAGAPYPPQR